MHDSMLIKLERLQNRLTEIEALLIDSDTLKDMDNYTLLNKEFSDLKPIVEKFHEIFLQLALGLKTLYLVVCNYPYLLKYLNQLTVLLSQSVYSEAFLVLSTLNHAFSIYLLNMDSITWGSRFSISRTLFKVLSSSFITAKFAIICFKSSADLNLSLIHI